MCLFVHVCLLGLSKADSSNEISLVSGESEQSHLDRKCVICRSAEFRTVA